MLIIICVKVYPRQKRGAICASSETKVVGKPNIRKWRYSSTHEARKPFCPPAYISLASKSSYVFVSQVGSITLLLPERISPRSDCKDTDYFRICKRLHRFFLRDVL